MTLSVLFLGNKDRGTMCLEALLESPHEVEAVVAPPESATEDWHRSPVPVAEEHDVPVHRPANVNNPEVIVALTDHEPDLTVMAGYNQILGEAALSIAPEGTLNLHGGKLPEYRGASTLNWMLIEGEDEGGITILFADEGIDTGDIVAQERFDIADDDTIVDVVERTNALFPGLLVDVIDAIDDGTTDRTPQTRAEGTYWHSRRPRDGEIHWEHMTARNVHNLVRSLAGPYPSAFTHHEGTKLEITRTSVPEENVRGIPGRVARTLGEGVLVVAADRAVLVERVKPADGEEQPAREYFLGVGSDLG